MDPKPKKLLLTWLTLAVMLVALAGCVEKLPPENLDAPLPEATAPLTTDFVPKRVPVERLKGNLYDVYHMDDTRVLLAAEGIYIFDLATGQFLAKNETIIPEAARVSFQILDDTIARFGLNYELMNGEDQVISRTHAAIYDAELNLLDIIDPSHQYEPYKNLYGAGCMELSPDGEYLYYCGDMGVQRLHIATDEALPIQWYYQPMEAALGIRVLDEDRVLYGHHASAYDTHFRLRYEISDLDGKILWHKEVGDYSSIQQFGDKFLITDATQDDVRGVSLFDPATYEESEPPFDTDLLAQQLPGGDFERFVTLISMAGEQDLRLMTYDLETGALISKRQMAITTPLGEEEMFAYVLPLDDLGWNLILIRDWENNKLDIYYDRFLPFPE